MVLGRSRVARVGAVAILCLILLTGCKTVTKEVPVFYLSDGSLVAGDKVQNRDGTERMLSARDKTNLYFVPNNEGDKLTYVDLATYEGTIYALSDYYYALLENGYSVEQSESTPDTLDYILGNGTERVRLVYMAPNTIRIMYDNWEGDAHILLERM